MNRTPRRKKEVNINTNFSMFNKGRSGQDRGILIDKTEPIGVIETDGSGNFNICDTFAVNPGQSKTFPILSQEAKVYEKYMFEELEFFTVPLVSEYAIGGQQGQIALAINYNPALPPPASQTAALSLKPYDANLPCLPLKIRCTKPDLTQTTAMFVRTSNLPGNSDIKTYDVANLFVTCEGLYETNFSACRLFVRYKCRLFNRVVLTDQGAPMNMSCSYFFGEEVATGPNISSRIKFTQTICDGLKWKGLDPGTFVVPASGNYNIDVNIFINRPATVGASFGGINGTLWVDNVITYPAIQNYGGMWDTTKPIAVTGASCYCLALKEGQSIYFAMQVDYTGTNNVTRGGFIRITSI